MLSGNWPRVSNPTLQHSDASLQLRLHNEHSSVGEDGDSLVLKVALP